MGYMIYGEFNAKSGKMENSHYFDKLNEAIKWAWKKAKTNGDKIGTIRIYKWYKSTGHIDGFIGEVRYYLNTLMPNPIYYKKYSKGAFLKTAYFADKDGNLKAIPRRDQHYVLWIDRERGWRSY